MNRRQLVSQIAAKAQLLGTRFSDSHAFERNQVVALTEARIPTFPSHRRTFGIWMPLSKEIYSDSCYREAVQQRTEQMIVPEIERLLFENRNIIGPKGKLPA